jgi:2',3'-cyclic-nucleotide 2'-phosphodiesterase (5'-nucleotidase family)
VLSNEYVDLIFEGHTHQDSVSKDGAGIYHLQNGGDNEGISHAQVTINYANGNSTVEKAEFVRTSQYTHLSDDPIVETLMKKYEDEISLAGKVLGKNSKYRNSREILNTCAKLYYETALATWGDEYDIVLGGGFMSARSPYNLQAGTVTYGDLQMILPFDNQLVLCSISGYDLKTKFFETTNDRYYIYYESYGEQVKANIQYNKTYYIITDTYTSTYRYNNLTEIARFDETTFARDLLAAYIEQGGWA